MRQTIQHVAKCHSCPGLVWVLRDGLTFRIVIWSLNSGRRKIVDEFPFTREFKADALQAAGEYCSAYAGQV